MPRYRLHLHCPEKFVEIVCTALHSETFRVTKFDNPGQQTTAQNPKAVERYLRETDDVPITAGALAPWLSLPVNRLQ
jgi:hypothetical protein